MKQPFHIRLCKAMDIRKFKQVDIVERTKLQKSAVSQYVSGKYIPKVMIGDEATLKRVYANNGEIVLMSANQNYKPLIYKKEEMNDVRILGKAVSFLSKI